MRWFISVKFAALVISAVLVCAPAAYACPLCFASSSPGVLRAYLVSAFFMIALAWGVIGAITLYAFHIYSENRNRETRARIWRRRARIRVQVRLSSTKSDNTNSA